MSKTKQTKLKFAAEALWARRINGTTKAQVMEQLSELLDDYPKFSKKQIESWIAETFENILQLHG